MRLLSAFFLRVFLFSFALPVFAATDSASTLPLVTIAAKTSPEGRDNKPASFAFTRTGDLSTPLEVKLETSGTAKVGEDFQALPDSITIPANSSSATLEVRPIKPGVITHSSTVTMKLAASERYKAGTPDSATLTLAPPKPLLFVATLRPTREAVDSTAYGTATLLLSPDGSKASITVLHSNLTSPLVSSHLKLGTPTEDGAYLMNFPKGQRVSFEWDFHPTGDLSSDDLRAALDDGRIYVGLDSKNYSSGELRGQFIRSGGSQKFTAPAAPPALPAGLPTTRDAARFLTQATFGPTRTDIDEVAKRNLSAWINDQMAVPASSHLELTRADFRAFPPKTPKPRISNANRQIAWWQIAVTGPDQLRQRVAFALSEIFVVSDVNDMLAGNPESTAGYYDMLARDAFGNFRQLLDDVTRSPIMGAYLSHLKNAKADPKRDTSPDENYAREVMQLFTIGLNQLQPDGTFKLGLDGLPIPTYDQSTIVETAKVFTGWGFYSPEPKPNFGGARPNFFQPMMFYPGAHDDGPKTIVGGVKLPAGQGGVKDLEQTLDTLFNHPNTGPFICRQLIQRLVTSNPSPAYVYRVSQVFAKNGFGERGDLGAVVRAILLDYEARSPQVLGNVGYGKLKEPLLQATALLRAFNGSAANGRFGLTNAEGALGQAALRSPTVFNFFEPEYVLPGPLAAAGLHAPEYQILTDTTAISIPNQLRNFIHTPAKPADTALTLQLDPIIALAKEPDAILDYLSLVFCGGAMTDKTRQRITFALSELPTNISDLERARCALELTVTSPDATIQR